MALMPLMSALLASLFAREALTASRLGDAGLSLLGLWVLSIQGEPGALLDGSAHLVDALMHVVGPAPLSRPSQRWTPRVRTLAQAGPCVTAPPDFA